MKSAAIRLGYPRLPGQFSGLEKAAAADVRLGHQQQMHDEQGEADRHREVHGADRDPQHRRGLSPGEQRIARTYPQHGREESEQDAEDRRADGGGVARQRILQRVDADVRRRSAAPDRSRER